MSALSWNYTSLTLALQNWLDDTDTDWANTTTLAQVVQLGEQRLVDDFDLMIFDQPGTASLVASTISSSVNRPAGIIVTDDLGYLSVAAPVGKWISLERRDYSYILDYLDPTVQGPPRYYAEADAATWIVAPYPDVNYQMLTWGPFTQQSLLDVPPNATTWLSTNLAQCMLEACITEVARFLKNTVKAQQAEQTYLMKLGPMKKRLRALRRDTLESPRNVSSEQPEGATPGSREA